MQSPKLDTYKSQGPVPIVQSHNSKVTAQQCISMNPHFKDTAA